MKDNSKTLKGLCDVLQKPKDNLEKGRVKCTCKTWNQISFCLKKRNKEK